MTHQTATAPRRLHPAPAMLVVNRSSPNFQTRNAKTANPIARNATSVFLFLMLSLDCRIVGGSHAFPQKFLRDPDIPHPVDVDDLGERISFNSISARDKVAEKVSQSLDADVQRITHLAEYRGGKHVEAAGRPGK